jgi:tRNA(adenine34) deaminase
MTTKPSPHPSPLPSSSDVPFLQRALALAREAAAAGETPVGAVVVRRGEIVGEGRNRREQGKNALFHAEIEAIDAACKRLGGWRLWECDIYVTLEPCPMCAGAILNARIRRVIFGAHDPKAGCCGSVVDLFDLPFNHRPEITGGLLEADCAEVLRAFFAGLRKKGGT